MTVISTASSQSFDNARNSWVPMHTAVEAPRDSNYELQDIGAIYGISIIKPSWRSFFAFTTRNHSFSIVVAAIFTIASSLLKPIAAIFFGNIFSSLTKYGSGNISAQLLVQQVSKWCRALTALGIAGWFLEGGFLSSWMIFGELQARCVREQMFQGMLDKNMEWYDLRTDGIGSLLVRIQTQIRELQISVSQPMGFLLYEVSASIASIGLALYYSWNLTLVIVATFPLAAFALFLVSMNLGPAIESQKRDLTLASKYASTAITSINTVKAFNGQDHEVWQYYSAIKNVGRSYLIQARSNALQFGIIKFFMIGIFVQGFWYGFVLVNRGMDPGHVVTTFYACLTAMQAVEIVLPQWLVLAKGMSAAETLKSIMIRIKDSLEPMPIAGSLRPDTCSGDIEVNGLSFAYPSNPRQDVLSNATFFFPAGETTFVVGKSGSGKSTLGNLLLKYYEPLRGEILVDSHPMKELDTDWLRQNINLVQQQSVLFNETIFQNIAFGKQEQSTTAEVWEAAKTADLEKTLLGLSNGLDTLVGSNGKSLSGGQQQRVAIARARLRDAPILILDEATSALDHASRGKVNKAIREWRKGKTTVIITHDVSQILDDEYVYVLDNGILVQEGYCKNLAEKSHGTFASFLPSEYEKPGLRRNSEPATPTTPGFGFFQEDFSNRWASISNIFGVQESSPNLLSNNFSARVGNRMSLGIGSIHASALLAENIWSTAVIPTDEGQFQLVAPREIPSHTVSPRRKPEPIVPTFSPVFGKPPLKPSPLQRDTTSENPGSRPLGLTIITSPVIGEPLTHSAFERLSSLTPRPLKLPEKRRSNTLKEIFSTIWPILVWREKMILILGFLAAIVVACATPAFAFLFAKLLSVFYAQENETILARNYSIALLGVAVLDGLASFLTHYALEYSGQAWINSLRVEALRRILAQPKSWFDKEQNSSSRLNECLDRNAEEMRNLIGRFAGPVFTALLMLLISILWSFTISWKLTLVALACVPVMYIFTRLFDYVSSKWEDKCNIASTETSGIFTETFSNIRVVRALTLESYFHAKHHKATSDTFYIGQTRAVYSGFLFGFSNSISFFISALIFYYGTVIISTNELSVSKALAVVQLLLFGIANSAATVALVPQINSSRTTATQMLYLANLPLHSHESNGTRRLETPFPIVFKNLNFTYAGGRKIKTLEKINLTLAAGSCTALVGPSGSGKSTIASILLSLYPPDPVPSNHAPALTFSGVAVEHCNTSSLRSYISIVPQSPQLFPSSIWANITYGLPELSQYASLHSAQQAARDAGIHHFIMSLDQGYQTMIGEGGMGLSGGQAQRIAIARALVRHPKVLVLDEATSALDAVSAEAIRQTIQALIARGREMAVVVISHGIEMMKIADQVVMIENGRVIERGTFEALMDRGGEFSKLVGMGWKEGVRMRDMTPIQARSRETWYRKGSV